MTESATKALQQLQVIWGALVGGVVLYTVLIFSLITAGVLDVATFDPDVMTFVGAGVMVYMVAALIVRRSMVAAIPADADPDTRVSRYKVATIVPMALMESGGLLLVSLAILTGAATWALAGGGAAAVLMFFARPSADELG
ncbi:MAG: hypothetical protein AAF389_09710 [Gemmatimonadota bacterium]